jgi:hypothetical protein
MPIRGRAEASREPGTVLNGQVQEEHRPGPASPRGQWALAVPCPGAGLAASRSQMPKRPPSELGGRHLARPVLEYYRPGGGVIGAVIGGLTGSGFGAAVTGGALGAGGGGAGGVMSGALGVGAGIVALASLAEPLAVAA